MNLLTRKFERIKNLRGPTLQRDFSYNAFSFFVLSVFLGVGIGLQSALHPGVGTEMVLNLAVGTLVAGGMLTIVPVWGMMILFIVAVWIALFSLLGSAFMPIIGMITAGLLLSPSLQLVYHWDKVVTLRMGKFLKTRGPGLFFLLPILDRAAAFIDTRIRATDFSAEKTLTTDTVPVHVDALAFWMIWDAQRAVLEVEDFVEAVVLSAQTALRDSIGKHELSSLLSEREELGKEIQKALDAKTNPWGISILSIEITDIIIPRELEDAMSRRAQAERERQSRVILGTAEVEVAKKFEEAAKSYEHNPTALQLRAMNMVYEGLRHNKGSLMLLPSSALDQMNLGTVLGSAAFHTRQSGQEIPDEPNRPDHGSAPRGSEPETETASTDQEDRE